MAPSPSGKAGACKASIPSSNLGGASKQQYKTTYGELAELVECTGFEIRRGVKASQGSNPWFSATIYKPPKIKHFKR